MYDCEKKWLECLRKNDGRITIASFYKMAQEAGVDLTAIARQFPSKPQLPHGYEERRNQQGEDGNNGTQHSNNQLKNNKNNCSVAPTPIAADSGEESEVLRFSFSQTFSQNIDPGKLPVTIQNTLDGKDTAEEQDKTLLADLDLLAVKIILDFGKQVRQSAFSRNIPLERFEVIREVFIKRNTQRFWNVGLANWSRMCLFSKVS